LRPPLPHNESSLSQGGNFWCFRTRPVAAPSTGVTA